MNKLPKMLMRLAAIILIANTGWMAAEHGILTMQGGRPTAHMSDIIFYGVMSMIILYLTFKPEGKEQEVA